MACPQTSDREHHLFKIKNKTKKLNLEAEWNDGDKKNRLTAFANRYSNALPLSREGGGLRLHKLEHLSPPSTKHEYFTSLEILECFRAVTKEMGPLTHSVTYLE